MADSKRENFTYILSLIQSNVAEKKFYITTPHFTVMDNFGQGSPRGWALIFCIRHFFFLP